MAETATQQVLTPVGLASTLAASILGKRHERLQARANEPPWKPRRHYASNLSGCARQMVYAISHYQEREPFDVEAIAHMDDGRHEERLLIQELLTDGFDVVEQQVQLDDDRYWVTGKIDGKLRWQGKRVPFEVKRVSPYVLEKLQTVADLKADEWMLKKLRQLTLYLYLHSEDAGLLILSDGRGARKVIVVPLDYELAESILKDLDTANTALKKIQGSEDILYIEASLPPRIPYHSKVCGSCPFKRTCLPDMNFGEGAVLGDEELKTAVEQYVALKPQASAFEKVKKEIAATVKEKPLVVAGDTIITGEWRTRKIKAQAEREDRWWAWEVETPGGRPDA